jgi:hypothetical protein
MEEKNTAFVLEAFDTLFNTRGDGAAERYWSPNDIQRSAHIAPSRDGLGGSTTGCVRTDAITERPRCRTTSRGVTLSRLGPSVWRNAPGGWLVSA